MFPLKLRKIGGYKFSDKTFYNKFHIGTDLVANYVKLYAPFNGTVKTSRGLQGGLTITFKPDNDDVEIRFLHLSKFVKTGQVRQGEVIAVTGNSGNSSSPHLHIDISKTKVDLSNIKNFIDPELYRWNMLTQTVYYIKKGTGSIVEEALEFVYKYFEKITNSEFSLHFVPIESDYPLTSIKTKGLSGTNNELIDIVIINPENIKRAVGGKKPSILFYNPDLFNPRPTNPVDNGEVSQLGVTPTTQVGTLAEFIVHELLHNWYKTLGLADDVHTHSGIYDPRPQANYFDIILKLKPFWEKLIRPMAQFKTQNYHGELRIVLQASTLEEWQALCKVYGVDPTNFNEII